MAEWINEEQWLHTASLIVIFIQYNTSVEDLVGLPGYDALCVGMMTGKHAKLKKIQNSEKNSEVSGWVKPQLGFFFFVEILCFLCVFLLFYMFPWFCQLHKIP